MAEPLLKITNLHAEIAEEGTEILKGVELELQAGEYALLCFIPDARDGAPHVAHGMIEQITVS